MKYKYVDTGETRSLGKPAKGSEHTWFQKIHYYITSADTLEESSYDVIFVDGRARVAVAMHMWRYFNPRTVLFVHDFWRTKYHVHLEYYELIFEVDSLAVLKRKVGKGSNIPDSTNKFIDWL